jgi:hypothetical protein
LARVLKYNAFPAAAGDAMKPLSNLFFARISNVRPGLIIVVVPSWLQK